MTLGNRFLDNKLGFVVAGSYQHVYRGNDGTFYVVADQPNAGNVVSFNSVEHREYSVLQSRTGIHAKVDYSISHNTSISLYNLFVQLDEAQHRVRNDLRITDVGDYNIRDRSLFQHQTINSTTFNVDHKFTNYLKLDAYINYSIAYRNSPDRSELSVKTTVDKDIYGNLLYPGNFINSLNHRWDHNSDIDKVSGLNLNYTLSRKVELAAGGLYRNKTRSNYYTDATLTATGYDSNGKIIRQGQPYTNLDNTVFTINGGDGLDKSQDGRNYHATENISAGYVQAKYQWNEKLQLLGGARIENTYQYVESAVSEYVTGKRVTNSYLDILPSLHFKYLLSDKQNLRLSYFKGITRPALFELVNAPNQGDYFVENGNPYVKHTEADNIDLRYEFFPKGSEQILAGVFYKNIINPIEYSFVQVSNNSYNYAPGNFGNATNYGFELVATKYIKNWGVSGNYTYTQSSITTSKRVINSDGTAGTQSQTRPLQGQSNHIANLSLIYKNTNVGIDAQLSWVYTGKRINVVSAYLDLDYWQMPTSQLDFSAEKKIGKHFSIYAKATNLLNNSILVEILKPLPIEFTGKPDQADNSRVLVQNDHFNQTITTGLRFKFQP